MRETERQWGGGGESSPRAFVKANVKHLATRAPVCRRRTLTVHECDRVSQPRADKGNGNVDAGPFPTFFHACVNTICPNVDFWLLSI